MNHVDQPLTREQLEKLMDSPGLLVQIPRRSDGQLEIEDLSSLLSHFSISSWTDSCWLCHPRMLNQFVSLLLKIPLSSPMLVTQLDGDYLCGLKVRYLYEMVGLRCEVVLADMSTPTNTPTWTDASGYALSRFVGLLASTYDDLPAPSEILYAAKD